MLQFEYPFLFLLLIPVMGLFLYRLRRFGLSREKRVIVIIRGLGLLLLIFALTIPTLHLPIKEKQVVFLIDRSKSVEEQTNDIISRVQKILDNKNAKDEFALMTFAETSFVEQSFQTHSSIGLLQEVESPGNTDIENALINAANSFEYGSGRIVLFSDGHETVGTASEVTNLLKEQGVEVDVVPLSSIEKEDMAITDLSVSESMFEGEQGTISIRVRSNEEKEADIRISLNDRDIIIEQVDVKRGENVYTFTHRIEGSGLFVYKAEISAANDHYVENNSLYAVSNVVGTPKVLIVEETPSQLLTIFHDSGLQIESIHPQSLPTSLSHYLKYQSIIFNNISGTDVTDHQMTLFEQSVKDFGTGFIMLGGENSFGLGGYFKTPIERILPVDMEIKGKEQLPSLGIIIVLDRSGSMMGNKLVMAKEAAARSVELLREEDTLGVIAFDDRPWVIIESGPIENKEETIDQIRSITEGGGTEIYPPLKQAYEELRELDLQRKHIILLTDGDSATQGDYASLIAEGKQDNITLSTVAIGQDANQNLLEFLANEGTGRFYNVTDETVIPSILSRETVMMTRTYIEDNPFYPTVYAIDGWEELFAEGVPQMNAYIATTPKSTAKIPLISEKEDPIVAEWQYGLGTTLAFTSDVTGKWSGNFAGWDRWPDFLNYLVSRSFMKYGTQPLSLEVSNERANTILQLKGDQNQLFSLETSIISDKGQVMESSQQMISPGEFELEMDHTPGLYFLQALQKFDDGKTRTFQTGFSISYSEEYLLVGTNQDLLTNIAEKTNGIVIEDETNVFRELRVPLTNQQSLSHWALLIVFFLLFFEFTIRRLGGQFLWRLFKKPFRKRNFRNTKQTSTTTTQLLKKKEKVNQQPRKRKTDSKGNAGKDQTIEQEKHKIYSSEEKESTQKEQVSSQPQLNKEERMKRLLEAKNRKNR